MKIDDWDHQRQYTINNIIEISRKEASLKRNRRLFFFTLAEMSVDMQVYDNASALAVYNDIKKILVIIHH